jgi:branched-chain amino acid transport system permease protein
LSEALQLVVNGVSMGCIYGLVALGLILIFNATGVINFAQGEFVMLGAFFGVTALVQWASPLVLGLGLVAAGMAAGGWVFQRLAYQPIRDKPLLAIIICTAMVSAFLKNTALLVWGPYPFALPSILPDRLLVVRGIVLPLQNLAIIVLTALLLLLLYWFFFRTAWGLRMRATAQDFDTARLMGIQVTRMVAATWILGALLGAAAGLLLAPMWNASIDMGGSVALKAFAACIIGGFGSVPGAVVGGVFVGLVEIMVASYLSSAYKDAFTFVIMVAFLIFLPQGIFGERIAEKA